MTQIINGQYDVDKLDYLRRDCYTAGLALNYDIERFLYKIKIAPFEYENVDKKELQLHLAMPVSGIATIEEMVFCKLMLYSYIYHHQKVLATEAIIADVIEALMNSEKLTHPCDFLYYCDDDIERMYSDSKDEDFKISVGDLAVSSLSIKKIKDLVRCIKNRSVPKRALVINFDTVDDGTKLSKATIAELSESLRGITGLREEICNCARDICDKLPHSMGGKQHIDKYDVFIKIPKESVGADLSSALIFTNEGEFKRLSDIVRLSDWSEAFAYHKWNAYVFSRPEIAEFVSLASVIVLKKYGINFRYDVVFNNLKGKERIFEVIDFYKKSYGVVLFA